MPHLGAGVAAYVDGQLSPSAQHEASEHLEACAECEKAVRQQRLLKSRMSTVAAPEPPAALLASLAELASAPPARETWWSRVARSLPVRAGTVLAAASLAVVVTAYAAGGPGPRVGDEVAPPFDQYAAEFTTPDTGGDDDTVITAAAMDDLNDYGWACHSTLAGTLHRVSGAYTADDSVISIAYTDGVSRLDLLEQAGTLDRSSLRGFEPQAMAGSDVWVRPGVPMVVTWDDSGTVFTIVTDVDRARVEQAVAQLPSGTERGLGERLGDGLNRMSSWLGAA